MNAGPRHNRDYVHLAPRTYASSRWRIAEASPTNEGQSFFFSESSAIKPCTPLQMDFGRVSRDAGQSRLPAPPHMMSGMMRSTIGAQSVGRSMRLYERLRPHAQAVLLDTGGCGLFATARRTMDRIVESWLMLGLRTLAGPHERAPLMITSAERIIRWNIRSFLAWLLLTSGNRAWDSDETGAGLSGVALCESQ
jgi:hypothetical protein